ncbi:MAG TPA: orotidine-5'-phosphate decarboxylase [Acidobacteriaceae bacterium]|nr:orotidine-5'-phosphate decarboxylase [Acidobacteriaceae bacterium]
MDPRLIVALDFPDASQALALAERIEDYCRFFKVGLELYLAEGHALVHELRHRGYSVFLDLKLHDIPNTVAAAVLTAAGTGASMLTVHALGGPAMLRAAVESANKLYRPPLLLAVTVLTSMDSEQLAAVGIDRSPGQEVQQLAATASAAGMTGLVCSYDEAAQLRRHFPNATLVIPGIRPAGSPTGDQKRIATPASALAAGADFLVVGRPITRAVDPVAAARAIIAEMHATVPVPEHE